MKKLKRGDIPPVEKENERDENYCGNNAQIDSSRTSNNFDIIKCGGSYLNYVDMRIKELGCRTKKDTVLISSFVVGASPEFFKGMSETEIKRYFHDCAEFFAKRYGKENVVSAVVHLDETTPHLHLNLIPVFGGRLCCKQLFDRTGLRNLQTDIHEKVGRRWGLKRGEQGSKRKHLDTAEYKLKMTEEQADKLEKLCDDKRTEYFETEEALEKLQAEKSESEADIANLTAKKETLEKEVADITETHGLVTSEVNKPIPVFGKTEEIKSLRAKNAVLQEENKKNNEAIHIAQRDNGVLFRELQAEQEKRKESDSKAARNAKTASEAEEIKALFPTEYAELLRRTQAVKSERKKKSNFNGWSK